MGRFPSQKSPGKQPIKKRGVKRFLKSALLRGGCSYASETPLGTEDALSPRVFRDLRPYRSQKRPFVHNSGCSQFSEGLFAIFGGVFAILFELLLIEIEEEIRHFAVLGGGG